MGEWWDIYDVHKKKIGKTAERDVYPFADNEYHIVVAGVIMNAKGELLERYFVSEIIR